jgi:hypothetical protein
MKRFGLCLAVVAVLAAPAALAGFDDGVAAYDRGDYAAAFEAWQPLAEQGDVRAQYRLGRLYETGGGVAQDDAQALRWFEAAGAQGDKQALVSIGIFHQDGLGVPQDTFKAYMWWEIAARHGSGLARALQTTVERQLTQAEKDEARRLADEWRP